MYSPGARLRDRGAFPTKAPLTSIAGPSGGRPVGRGRGLSATLGDGIRHTLGWDVALANIYDIFTLRCMSLATVRLSEVKQPSLSLLPTPGP